MKIKSANLIKNKAGTDVIKVCFPFNYPDLELIRTIPNRKFNPDGKYWIIPFILENIEKLQDAGFVLDASLSEFIRKARLHVNDVRPIEIKGLRGELFPYQKTGVAFTEYKNGRALIADEMGLGKTIQAIAYLQLHREFRPAIIVCPASLKLNWARELQRWMPSPNIQIVQGITPCEIVGEIIIINYDILAYWVEELLEITPQVIVFDEIHYTKSNKAKRTKAAKAIAKHTPHVIGLSGTPILNRPIEAYNALKMIDSTVVPDMWTYAMRYCGAKNNGFGWDFSGASNTTELHKHLTNTVMIRRLKRDVLPDLPDKIYSFVPMELSDNSEYLDAERDFISYLKETKGEAAARKASAAEVLVKIEGLKQIAVRLKLKSVFDFVDDFLESDNKLVLFATHKFTINELMQRYKKISVKIDGETSMHDRQYAVDEFQNNNNIKLFVGNIKAAGVGITLTASSNVAFVELPWTPADIQQCEDRCHRIGQKDSVNVYYLLAVDTIEERIATLIDSKRKVLDSILDGTVTEEQSLLGALINQFNT